MAQIIAVAIQKGGTGKTTTAAAIAQAAAARGLTVLAVDLDPQANLSLALGANMTGGNAYSLIADGQPAADCIRATAQHIDIIPASASLSTVTSSRGSARRLQNALQPIKDNYRLIVIDTPPTAGELQYNAMQAATGLIIPLQADIYSLQSLYQVADTARQIQKSNPSLVIKGIVFTQYDRRSTLSRQMREAITQQAAEIEIPTLGAIRNGIAVKEAAALKQSLFDYAPGSNPAKDYLELFNALNI